MSEKLCTLRTKGGGGGGSCKIKPILLWENPSPSASFSPSEVNIISGVEYDPTVYGGIILEYKKYYTDTTIQSQWINDIDLTQQFFVCSTRDAQGSSLYNQYIRQIMAISTTKLKFGNAFKGGTNYGTAYNNYMIPIKVYMFEMPEVEY